MADEQQSPPETDHKIEDEQTSSEAQFTTISSPTQTATDRAQASTSEGIHSDRDPQGDSHLRNSSSSLTPRPNRYPSELNPTAPPPIAKSRDLLCSICNGTSHSTAQCFMTNPLRAASFIARHPEQKDYWEQRISKFAEKHDPNRRSAASSTASKPRRLCFQCSSPDHVRRDCPEIVRECYYCGSKRHFTSDCVGGVEALLGEEGV